MRESLSNGGYGCILRLIVKRLSQASSWFPKQFFRRPSLYRDCRKAALAVLVGAASAAAAPSVAQTRPQPVTLDVFVTDTGSVAIADAIVDIKELKTASKTDSHGKAEFQGLTSGLRRVLVTHRGFAPSQTNVILGLDDSLEIHVRLIPISAVRSLDTVTVTESRPPEYLEGYFQRRSLGLGRFLSEAQLDSSKHERMSDFAARHFTGIISRCGIGRGPCELISTRGASSFGRGKRPVECRVQVYIDDMFAAPEDLGFLSAGDVSAAEFYSNVPPVQYSRAGAHCGVLVIWTKR